MRRRLSYIFLLLVVIASGLINAIPATTLAAPSTPATGPNCPATWVDMWHVDIDNSGGQCSDGLATTMPKGTVEFTFADGSDTKMHLHSISSGSGSTNSLSAAAISAYSSDSDTPELYQDSVSGACPDTISDNFSPNPLNQNNPTNGSTLTLSISNDPTNCENAKVVTLHPVAATQNRFAIFTWSDSGTITTPIQTFYNVISDSGDDAFSVDANFNKQTVNGKTEYVSQPSDADSCFSYLVPSSDNTTATLVLQRDNGNGCDNGNVGDGYYFQNVVLLDSKDATKKAGTGTAAQDNSSNTDATAPELSCHAGYNPLNWLVCGVIDGLTQIINAVDNFINSQLSVGTNGTGDDPSQIFGNSGTAQSYYQAWSAFRDLSLGLMVAAGLVVIISQALGFELLDAYTLRKVLPRLVVAAIAITVSWSLMQFFVKFTNDLGFGIRNIIYAPFDKLQFYGLNLNAGGGQGVAVSIATLGAITALGIFGLLSFVGTAALAVFVAFLVLVIRQILIIVLILAAPVAIVAYILPNTNKIYKLWWDSFAKALMMFPIISGFIAAGRVMSVVADQNQTNPFSQFVAFAAYFAPYFLLPLTFRFAGGALSNIGGFVNDRHKGGFDRLRNFRGKKMQENMQKVGNYSRLSDRNAVTRGINTMLGAGANPRNLMGGVAGVRRGRAAGRAAQGAANLKDNKIFNDNQHDDNFLMALADRDMAETKLAGHRAKYDAARAAGDTAGMNKYQAAMIAQQNGLDSAAQVDSRNSRATQRAALDALTKTGYQLSDGQQGYNELSSIARRMAGGDDGEYAKLMNQSQYNLKEAGRYDLAGINDGAGYDPGKGLGKVDPYTLGARAKPASVAAKGELMRSSLVAANAARARGDMDGYNAHMETAAIHRNELKTGYDSATDANRDEFIKQLGTADSASTDAVSRATGTVMDAWSTTASGRTRTDPSGAVVPVTVQERQQYVAGTSPTTGPGAWTSADIARGHRTIERAETRGDIARTKSKGLSRMPNPAEL